MPPTALDAAAPNGIASGAASRWHRPLLLAAILVAFAIRLYHLGAESLWYDETVSVYLSRLPLPAMVAHTAGDIHPPGYYALLHAWQALAAPSLAHGLEFLYAYPSLVFGLLALPLLYILGRRLFGPRTGLAALWLGAFAPFLVWYSQEVRMYTLGAFLGLLCLWALLKFCDPALYRRTPFQEDSLPERLRTKSTPSRQDALRLAGRLYSCGRRRTIHAVLLSLPARRTQPDRTSLNLAEP